GGGQVDGAGPGVGALDVAQGPAVEPERFAGDGEAGGALDLQLRPGVHDRADAAVRDRGHLGHGRARRRDGYQGQVEPGQAALEGDRVGDVVVRDHVDVARADRGQV